MSFFLSLILSSSLILSTSSIDDSAANAMKFIETDVKTVVEFSIDWAMQAALAGERVTFATSINTHQDQNNCFSYHQ